MIVELFLCKYLILKLFSKIHRYVTLARARPTSSSTESNKSEEKKLEKENSAKEEDVEGEKEVYEVKTSFLVFKLVVSINPVDSIP
jgi:hypothetical protein